MSHILVLNCGSSSVKFALINPQTTQSLFTGLAENIGQENCSITFKSDDKKQLHLKNGQYKDIFLELKKFLDEKGFFDKVMAIGHRVVAGGQYFSKSALITPENLEKIKEKKGVQNHYMEKKLNVLLTLFLKKTNLLHFKWIKNVLRYENKCYI